MSDKDFALTLYQKAPIHIFNSFFFSSPRKFSNVNHVSQSHCQDLTASHRRQLAAPYPWTWCSSDCLLCSLLPPPQGAQIISCPREKAESKAWDTRGLVLELGCRRIKEYWAEAAWKGDVSKCAITQPSRTGNWEHLNLKLLVTIWWWNYRKHQGSYSKLVHFRYFTYETHCHLTSCCGVLPSLPV